jgi:hypothetical protein
MIATAIFDNTSLERIKQAEDLGLSVVPDLQEAEVMFALDYISCAHVTLDRKAINVFIVGSDSPWSLVYNETLYQRLRNHFNIN